MTDDLFVPRFNPRPVIRGMKVGREQQPVVIIDNVLENPEDMVDLACRSEFTPPKGSAYPGLNAPAPKSYTQGLAPLLSDFARSGFGVPAQARLSAISFMALATTPADELSPLQRIPHFDSPDPHRLAVVHYFCGPEHGGTVFFRHRSTGFETVTTDQVSEFDLRASAELRLGLPRAYTGPQTPYYEPVAQVEAVFNRLIMYRSNGFHSALLNGATLSSDPRTGRLTVNSFISVIPD